MRCIRLNEMDVEPRHLPAKPIRVISNIYIREPRFLLAVLAVLAVSLVRADRKLVVHPVGGEEGGGGGRRVSVGFGGPGSGQPMTTSLLQSWLAWLATCQHPTSTSFVTRCFRAHLAGLLSVCTEISRERGRAFFLPLPLVGKRNVHPLPPTEVAIY